MGLFTDLLALRLLRLLIFGGELRLKCFNCGFVVCLLLLEPLFVRGDLAGLAKRLDSSSIISASASNSCFSRATKSASC